MPKDNTVDEFSVKAVVDVDTVVATRNNIRRIAYIGLHNTEKIVVS